eukprot:NODE_2861_length_632_cov_59.243568_g2381_i0.p1 GENE.NODE_2861_length_632_cov_59.243568_g2381_i0~~NODE_2861_length_632_cov_59.243568_g2381_i0.p1  ORF type:complete len:134 (+),score=15.10 NODE_2861_length_632_cov_59.243568_g2381_i0:81-482(+)
MFMPSLSLPAARSTSHCTVLTRRPAGQQAGRMKGQDGTGTATATHITPQDRAIPCDSVLTTIQCMGREGRGEKQYNTQPAPVSAWTDWLADWTVQQQQIITMFNKNTVRQGLLACLLPCVLACLVGWLLGPTN